MFSMISVPVYDTHGIEECIYIINHGKYDILKLNNIIAPAGFWPRGQSPRRHPRSPRVYTYKNKEYLLKK